MSTLTIIAAIVLIVAAAIFGNSIFRFFELLVTTKQFWLAWYSFKWRFARSGKTFWTLCLSILSFFPWIFNLIFRRNNKRGASTKPSGVQAGSRLRKATQIFTLAVVAIVVIVIGFLIFRLTTSSLGLSVPNSGLPSTDQQIVGPPLEDVAKTTSIWAPILGVLYLLGALVGIAALSALAWLSYKHRDKWGKKIPWEFFLLLLTLNALARWLIPSFWIPFWDEHAYFWSFNVGVLIAAAFHKWDHKTLAGVFVLFLVICALVIGYNSSEFQKWEDGIVDEMRQKERLNRLEKAWSNGTHTVVAEYGDPNSLRDWEMKNPYPVVIGENNTAMYFAKNDGDCYFVRFNGEGTGWKRCSSNDPIHYSQRVWSLEFMSDTQGKKVEIIVKIK